MIEEMLSLKWELHKEELYHHYWLNIALHGLREELDNYINSLGGHRANNRQALRMSDMRMTSL
jgi:hypothetical protein